MSSACAVGCGTGGSTRDLARIATDGAVLGIDLSSQMLRCAEQRTVAERLANIRFDRGDAQVYPFARETHDVVVSVLGAMFFGDPVAAFANIRTSLKPGTLALLT